MDKEQALARIEILISEAKDREDRLHATGYISALLEMGLIDSAQASALNIKAMGIAL